MQHLVVAEEDVERRRKTPPVHTTHWLHTSRELCRLQLRSASGTAHEAEGAELREDAQRDHQQREQPLHIRNDLRIVTRNSLAVQHRCRRVPNAPLQLSSATANQTHRSHRIQEAVREHK